MKKSIGIILVLVGVLLLASCTNTDVVLKYSRSSFEDIVKAYPAVIGQYENGFTVSADGETVLNISANFSADDHDIVISTPLAPFTAAGLDADKLGKGLSVDEENLYMSTNFKSRGGKTADVAQALFSAVDADRSVLSYHAELDHYGIALSSGKFEFAKDHRTNDKDLVFILDAAMLAEAGVDVNAVEGWIFAEMDGMQLLLKPYELQ